MALTKEQKQAARLAKRDKDLAAAQLKREKKAEQIAFNKSHEGLLHRLRKSGKVLVYQCPDQTVIAYHFTRGKLYKRMGPDEHNLGPRRKVSAIAKGHQALTVKGLL